MSNNLDQLTDWLKEHKITEVECLISDLTGITRGKISPTNKFIAEKGMRLPESVLLQTVTGDYVDDDIYYELLDPADIDMICRPDENAVFLVPWAIEPTAQVIHDTYDKKGNPVELSPRNVLKKVLKLYADKGWQPIVAPEMEFYLTKRSEDPDFPLQPPVGRSGRPETGRQSFSIEAANEFDPLFEDVYDWCELQQLDLDTLIHEDGTAQMEINFRHGDALHLADQILVFKRTMREAALKHNVAATFMAKPMTGEPGSAMHLHQSVVDVTTGKNIFSNEDGSMSTLFLNHIGGLQKFIPEALPLFAPNVNSFRRFLPDTSAPVNVEWGEENRTVGLRVPDAGPQSRRVENRLPGTEGKLHRGQPTVSAIQVTLQTPKTRKSRRVVILSSGTVARLREHQQRQQQEREILGPDGLDEDFVFANEFGGPTAPRTLGEWPDDRELGIAIAEIAIGTHAPDTATP